MTEKVYVLVLYTYDYYEFLEIIAISKDCDKLSKIYAENNNNSVPLVEEEYHEMYSNSDDEICHYCIHEYGLV